MILGATSAVFGRRALSAIFRSERLRGSTVALVDLDEKGLDSMTRLAEVMNREWGSGCSIVSDTQRRRVRADADFVIASVQVGRREEVWEKDWSIPLQHGIRQPYAENSGPGGLAHTARNLPLIRLSLGVHRSSSIKVVGMCHQLLWGYAMAAAILADRFGIDVPPDVRIDTNHEHRHFREPLSREVFRIFGLMPTPSDSNLCEYLPWLHDPVKKPWEKYGLHTRSWKGNYARRAERRELTRAVIEGRESVEKLRDLRSEGVPEVIEGVYFSLNTFIHQINLPNDGPVPKLPADSIVEVPGTSSGPGVRRLSMPSFREPRKRVFDTTLPRCGASSAKRGSCGGKTSSRWDCSAVSCRTAGRSC